MASLKSIIASMYRNSLTNMYLFTDESGGTYSRTKISIIPGSGRPSAGAWTASLRDLNGFLTGPGRPASGTLTAFRRGLDSLPPAPEQVASVARAPILQFQDSLPPLPVCPFSSSGTGCLRGQSGILQFQDRLPPLPECPFSSSGTGYLRGQSSHPPVPGQAASVARAAFLQLQYRRPQWPGLPSSSSSTGDLSGLGGLPVNEYTIRITSHVAPLQSTIASIYANPLAENKRTTWHLCNRQLRVCMPILWQITNVPRGTFAINN
jgi:hypothetical protein